MAQPDAADVHTPGSGAAPDQPPVARKGPGRNFLGRLHSLVKGKVAEKGSLSMEEFAECVRGARGHAGGMGKAEKRAQMATEDDLIDVAGVDAFALDDAEADQIDADADAYDPDADPDTRRAGEWRLFIEAPRAFAEPPDWVPFLPKPGAYAHPKWGKIVISADRNRHFVEQFQAGVYQRQLPLDAEHETKLGGAMGWIREMRLNPDGSADARVEWTDRGVAMIEGDRFRYISPEWYDEWTDPATGKAHRDVLIGGAITTRPFFKEGALRPMIASERGIEIPEPPPAPVTPPKERAMSITLTEEQAKAFAEYQATQARQAAELAEARTAVEASKAESIKLAERVAGMETDARARRFTDEVRGRTDANKQPWLGDVTKHVGFLEKLASAFGEGSDEVQHYVATQRAAAEQAVAAGLFTEQGRDAAATTASTVTEEIAQRAKAMAEAEKISQAEATGRVLDADPALQRRYMAEARA